MSNLTIFNNNEFGEIRTLEENGKPLFCGKDVASALGYKNVNDAIARHCKGVVK
ncbi:BRO-N domain-containing protein [Clostridium tertium]|mgnify:CR=1 FL=1|uniref:BRO-N domain-containing protein n=1 Tax=Clostridium tertium TaxID=1559 RepID=UPI003F6E19A8